MKQPLNTDKVNKVVERLKELDTASVKFHEAKQRLTADGYSNAEIVAGIYQFPYDGIPNVPEKPDKMAAYFEKHPKKADKFCRAVMGLYHDQAKDDAPIASLASVTTRGFMALSVIPSVFLSGLLMRGAIRRQRRRKSLFWVR